MNYSMNYHDFDDETKSFINKAIEIYELIKNRTIEKQVKVTATESKFYQFTNLDKKVMAIFTAGFLAEGKVKKILEEYEDFKLEDLLEFIGITENEISPLKDGNYEEYYNEKFKLDIMSLISDIKLSSTINYITPSVIMSSFRSNHFGSEILRYFVKTYNIGSNMIFPLLDHPLFKALKYNAKQEGSISEKEKMDNHKNSFIDPFRRFQFSDFEIETKTIPEKPKPKEKKKNFVLDERTWDILEEIKKEFIGQEDAVEGIFYNIVNNQQLAEMEDIPDGQRSIIFIDGPTGTGKTAITRAITEKLGIPFISTSVTNYSSTGYVGGDITDVLKELYKKADGDLEKAQRGIIVFDEFDKIAYSRSGGLEMKKAVQQQLLDFLGGGKYTIRTGNMIFDINENEFETSRLTFVCLGALSDLRSMKTETKKTIGFGQTSQSSGEQTYSITPQDLMNIGLERELVGRFNTYLHTNDYSKEDLERILRESSISPLLGFKKWIEAQGKQLVIDDDVYGIIAEQAYELNTGCRSLQTIINSIRTSFIKEVLRGKEDIIRLDAETVIEINRNTMTRKVRG